MSVYDEAIFYIKEKNLFSSWTVQLTTTKVLQMAFENLMLISSFDG